MYNQSMNQPSKPHKTTKPDKSGLLLDAAYALFLERGDTDISIREIADRAGVAKGTFYLYFRDKDDLKETLIAQKSNEFFQHAIAALHATDIASFDDQIIFVINYLINELAANQMALRLIAKNLSLGVFNRKVQDYLVDDRSDIVRSLLSAAKRSGIRLQNPRILLFMIIELTSSTCFSCILEERPLPIEEYKPYLFATIRQMIHDATAKTRNHREDMV